MRSDCPSDLFRLSIPDGARCWNGTKACGTKARIEYAKFAYESTCSYNVRVRKSIHTPQNERLLSLLRKLRTEAGLTQVDLAARIKKDQTFVSKYESGERRLDVLELREICIAVGVSLTQFVRRLEKEL